MNGKRNETLLCLMDEHRVLIASHRGTFGGNVIQNTVAAFETALISGAHILEVDAARSTDGDFYAFHTGQEYGLIGTGKRLDRMSSEEIDTYCYINSNQCAVREGVNRLDDVLEHFRNRCLINIDRGYFYTEDTLRLILRHGMQEQVIFKCDPKPVWLTALQEIAPDIMYMPVIRSAEELAIVRQYNVNLIGVEILFGMDEHALASEAFITQCHADNLLLWVNAITLDDDTLLCARHDDNVSLLNNRELGWGWLIDRGFDIIQTDWVSLLAQYLNERGFH